MKHLPHKHYIFINFSALFSNQIYFAAFGVQNLFCRLWSAKFILRPFSNQIYFAFICFRATETFD